MKWAYSLTRSRGIGRMGGSSELSCMALSSICRGVIILQAYDAIVLGCGVGQQGDRTMRLGGLLESGLNT